MKRCDQQQKKTKHCSALLCSHKWPEGKNETLPYYTMGKRRRRWKRRRISCRTEVSKQQTNTFLHFNVSFCHYTENAHIHACTHTQALKCVLIQSERIKIHIRTQTYVTKSNSEKGRRKSEKSIDGNVCACVYSECETVDWSGTRSNESERRRNRELAWPSTKCERRIHTSTEQRRKTQAITLLQHKIYTLYITASDDRTGHTNNN